MVEQERAKGHLRAVRVTPKVILGPSHLIATCAYAHEIAPPQTPGRSGKTRGPGASDAWRDREGARRVSSEVRPGRISYGRLITRFGVVGRRCSGIPDRRARGRGSASVL